ncbi:hypothetical protein P3S68_023530 [Capsicum galapagoense]
MSLQKKQVPTPCPSVSSDSDLDYLPDASSVPPDNFDVDITVDTPTDKASQPDHVLHFGLQIGCSGVVILASAR